MKIGKAISDYSCFLPFFSDKDNDKAIQLYTGAIELDGSNAILYANRSFAYLRQEAFGYALNDAVQAIKCNPNYLKGYYRRAGAHMALGKYKLALADLELVAKRCPNDKDAQLKYTECNKIVKKMAFERAIAVDKQEKSLLEMCRDLESASKESLSLSDCCLIWEYCLQQSNRTTKGLNWKRAKLR